MSGHVVALCGGVGGAKLAHGLTLALPAHELTVVVNTGDDFRHLGLYISPDLDSVLYALAALSDPIRGCGRREETWRFMEALGQLGGENWFQLGDGDLALHVERSWRLTQGATLSEVTAHLCWVLGIVVEVLPMSDDPVRTHVLTAEGWLDFQDYFVRRRYQPAVQAFEFSGAESAHAQPRALAALERRDLRAPRAFRTLDVGATGTLWKAHRRVELRRLLRSSDAVHGPRCREGVPRSSKPCSTQSRGGPAGVARGADPPAMKIHDSWGLRRPPGM